MKTLLTFAAITLAVAGCEHRPQPTVAEECAGYGFTAGTEDFANCQTRVTQARASRDMTCMDAAGAWIPCH